jgi:thiol-disulfide isomerase/thioredoxin
MQSKPMQRVARAVTLVCVILVVGCGTSSELRKSEPMELGWLERSALDKPDYPQFRTTYDTVRITEGMSELIGQLMDDVDVLVFLGTWCGDSKREVPRFLKIADHAGISFQRIRLYGVDRSKKSTDGLTDRYNIVSVPTFIFLKDGVEIGRIVEHPEVSIEADMIAILANQHGQ